MLHTYSLVVHACLVVCNPHVLPLALLQCLCSALNVAAEMLMGHCKQSPLATLHVSMLEWQCAIFHSCTCLEQQL